MFIQVINFYDILGVENRVPKLEIFSVTDRRTDSEKIPSYAPPASGIQKDPFMRLK